MSPEAAHFEIDEHGNYIFQHEGWEVRIWGGKWKNQIDVSAPDVSGETHEVELYEDSLYVRGESFGQWATSPASVCIPWPVLTAIIAARLMIDARELRQ